MNTYSHARRTIAALLLVGAPVFAGVTVVQNTGPGATSWPATPLLGTVPNPSAQAIVGGGFSGAAQKRAFVMGQYRRFVRPGDFRIGTSTQRGPLRTSAFRNTSTGRFAIVLINATTAAATQRVNLRGITASSVTPWITSPSQSLQQQAAVSVSGAAFTYNIPAQSIVTFVGP